jgi:flagellar basal body-associated protein FliL
LLCAPGPAGRLDNQQGKDNVMDIVTILIIVLIILAIVAIVSRV